MLNFLRRLTGVPTDAASRLAAAQQALADGRAAAAVSFARRAVEDAVPAGDPALAAAAADAWITALAGHGDARGEAAARCRALGVKTPLVLGAFAAHAALVARRADPDALEGYVEAVEARALADRAVRRAVLRVLAHGLYVASDETPSRFDGRVTLLERLAAAGVNPPFVGVYLGRHAYLRGDFARAARFLGSVGGRAAERPKVLTLLGRALEKLGRIDEACSAYAASLAADRRQAGVHYRLGRLLLAKYVDDLPR